MEQHTQGIWEALLCTITLVVSILGEDVCMSGQLCIMGAESNSMRKAGKQDKPYKKACCRCVGYFGIEEEELRDAGMSSAIKSDECCHAGSSIRG